MNYSASAYGYELVKIDLLDQVADIVGTPFQAVLTERGWMGRRTPVGAKRTAMLTPPCETSPDVVLYLIRRGHLRAPEGVWLSHREHRRQPRTE